MIIDCFKLRDELDILDVRLEILKPHVDHFVVYDMGDNESKLKDKEKVVRVSSPDFVMNDLSKIHGHLTPNETDILIYSRINEIPNLSNPNKVSEFILNNLLISFDNLVFLKRFDAKCYDSINEESESEKVSNNSIAFFKHMLGKVGVKKMWNKMRTLPKYNSEKGWCLSQDESLKSKKADPEDYLPDHFLEQKEKFRRFL